jgi:hypothetical protein
MLVPASCAQARLRETEAGSELLASFIPVLDEEVFAPLRAAGYSDQEIRDLGGLEGLP